MARRRKRSRRDDYGSCVKRGKTLVCGPVFDAADRSRDKSCTSFCRNFKYYRGQTQSACMTRCRKDGGPPKVVIDYAR